MRGLDLASASKAVLEPTPVDASHSVLCKCQDLVKILQGRRSWGVVVVVYLAGRACRGLTGRALSAREAEGCELVNKCCTYYRH